MQFSVLVIAHQRTGHLQRLIDGVQRNSMRPQEIVVVYMDDPFPRHVQSSIPLKSIHIARQRGDSGLPLARARNTAATHASSEHLVFLDVDCIPSAGCLAALLGAVKAHTTLAMAEPRYLRSMLPVGPTPADGELFELSMAHHARLDLPRDTPCQRHELFWSLGFAIATRHFETLGGFSEEYLGYGAEDTDFAFKARQGHLPVVFIREPVFHQHHGVFRPPLNHFASIVTNARRFHEVWGVWPMEGWLRAFTRLGLIYWDSKGADLEVRREPTTSQIDQARSEDAY